MVRYGEISEIAHLNWFPKFKNFFWRAHLPHTVFPIRIDPQNNVQLVNTQKKKKLFLQNAIFHFLLFFSPFLSSTQSEFGRYKREFKRCTPPIMVWLASSTPIVPILIPKWGQNMTMERQNLHIPQYSHLHPSFLALFLHFLSITCCTWTF